MEILLLFKACFQLILLRRKKTSNLVSKDRVRLQYLLLPAAPASQLIPCRRHSLEHGRDVGIISRFWIWKRLAICKGPRFWVQLQQLLLLSVALASQFIPGRRCSLGLSYIMETIFCFRIWKRSAICKGPQRIMFSIFWDDQGPAKNVKYNDCLLFKLRFLRDFCGYNRQNLKFMFSNYVPNSL